MVSTFEKMSEMSSVGPTDDEERITAIALAGELVRTAKDIYVRHPEFSIEECFDRSEAFLKESARYVTEKVKEYDDERKAKQLAEESKAAKEEGGAPDAGQ